MACVRACDSVFSVNICRLSFYQLGMVTSGRIRESPNYELLQFFFVSSTIDGRSFCKQLSVNMYFPRFFAPLRFRSRFVRIMRLP